MASVREPTFAALVGDDAKRLEPEEVLLPPAGAAHQQFERTVGGFEVVALVLEALERVDRLGERRAVEIEAELLRLQARAWTCPASSDTTKRVPLPTDAGGTCS